MLPRHQVSMNKVLDDYLCDKYPKIFVERTLSPRESCMGRGFETGNGYFPLIDSLCHQIQAHIDQHNQYCKYQPPIEQMVFQQVKEKFGGLRIYSQGGDEYCKGLIGMAEAQSYSICEICGKAGLLEVGHTKGLIQSVCKECAVKSKREIQFDNELTKLLAKAISDDNKEIFDFYANR